MIESTAAAARREGSEYAFGIWPARAEQLAPIRGELRRWLAGLGMTEEAQEAMILAVHEAVANSIEHAYPEASEDDTVELIFWTEPGLVCVEIVDHGVWRKQPTEPSARGRGISIMRRLTESVLIHRTIDGTSVLLRCSAYDGLAATAQ